MMPTPTDIPTQPAGTDTLVLAVVLGLGMLLSVAAVVRVLFIDVCARRAADVGFVMLGLRMGLGARTLRLVRHVAEFHPAAATVHPVGFLLCPEALLLASAAYLGAAPTPARSLEVARLLRTFGLEAVQPTVARPRRLAA